MVAKVFFSSDHHLLHDVMFKTFTISCPKCQGKACLDCGFSGKVPARPFKSREEMHTYMREKHNAVVGKNDHWYCLGDIVIDKTAYGWKLAAEELQKYNGVKRLILGNHDHLDVTKYREVFGKVRGYQRIDNLIFSHIPIHPSCIPRGGINVHGHTHTQNIEGPYLNLSVEQIDYTPVSLEVIRERAAQILSQNS